MLPIPSFPSYTGPHKVGIVDAEVPISELSSPAPTSDSTISTIQCRIFYPCDPASKHAKPIYWLPDPQHDHVSAFASFLGASPRVSKFVAYSSKLMCYAKIPAVRDAPLLEPSTTSHRWPVVVFSHGLGGFRYTYSHLCGSLASHGVVVVAPEHRDGSAPISFIRDANGALLKTVEYRKISHENNQEVQDARREQLKIRLWEIGLLHDLLLKIDGGVSVNNFTVAAENATANDANRLSMFKNNLSVHDPGSMTWAGHSFGAATMVQFVKSVFYRPSSSTPSTFKPLYCPAEGSAIVKQVTARSPMALLDIWMLPIYDTHTRWLREKPLPTYQRTNSSSSNVLAILSEGFFKWQTNLDRTKEILSPDPHSHSATPQAKPHVFYVATSAHLSQSDFGILFPFVTRMALKAQEPDRTLRLNVRAILQVLRNNDIEVADTSDLDQEIMKSTSPEHANGIVNGNAKAPSQDGSILLTDKSVRGWIPISLDDQAQSNGTSNTKVDVANEPAEVVIQDEIKQ